MRKCKVKVAATIPRPGEPGSYMNGFKQLDATFHQFGYRAAAANESGDDIQISVAIVELTDGKIMLADPADVQFTEPPPA